MSEAMAAVERAVRFGIKINKNEEDSNKRVTYLYDAVGMIPAVMDFVEGAFNYGSWDGVEFVKQLTELVPAAKRKQSKLAALREE